MSRKIILIILATASIGGCRSRGTSASSRTNSLGSPPAIRPSSVATEVMFGRSFTLRMLLARGSVPGDPKKPSWTLQIEGDDLIMGVGCLAPLAYRVSEARDAVIVTAKEDSRCNVTIQVTGEAGHYRVNGHDIRLAANHAWSLNADGTVEMAL